MSFLRYHSRFCGNITGLTTCFFDGKLKFFILRSRLMSLFFSFSDSRKEITPLTGSGTPIEVSENKTRKSYNILNTYKF